MDPEQNEKEKHDGNKPSESYNRIKCVKYLIGWAEQDDDRYFDLIHAIAIIFPEHLVEQLRQLVNGPIWDGNIISKVCRNELFYLDLAIRVCVRGEQGYTGATYIAYSILKKIEELKSQNTLATS